MNIQIQDVSPTRKSLVVSFDAKEVGIEYQAVVGEVSKQVRLPGFRPGKAPAALVLKQYAKNITEDFKQKIVGKAYRDALKETKLNVVQVTGIEEGTIAPDQAATITITVDLQPSFDLPELAGIPVTVAPEGVTDAEVATAVDALRGERADFKVAERASQKGDYVKLSYEGTVAGQAILEIVPDKQIYGKVPQTWEEVESENDGLIPGLGKQLGGLKTGDKKSVEIAFPAEFAAAPALAGKTASYAVEILEIRERVLPELNEEFFKSNQVDDLAGLQSKVRNNLVARKDHENQAGKRRQVVDALLAKIAFPVPESLVEQETQSVLRRFMEENMRRGVPAEQFEKDKAQLIEGARKAAEGRVRTQMILARIAEQEKLQVDANDIDAFLYRESTQSGVRPEKLVKDLTNDRDRLRAVQQSIVFDKALDLVVSKATVTEAAPAAV
ncbi:trigger factor [Verrucomicrobia bacterium IMCC26134]|nr:trigger factor [Verrucomicrobia bacterium IMCC26134]